MRGPGPAAAAHPILPLKRFAQRIHVQNHIDTEKLVLSLRIACHQPAGKNRMSPGCSVALIALGTMSRANAGCVDSETSRGANTSRRDVLLMSACSRFAAGLCVCAAAPPKADMDGVADGGASQTVFCPTTWTEAV
jgi:hypothetical protein